MAYTLINITHARRHESIVEQKAVAPRIAAPVLLFLADEYIETLFKPTLGSETIIS